MANRALDVVVTVMFLGLVLLNARGISSAVNVIGANYIYAVKGLQGRGLSSDMG